MRSIINSHKIIRQRAGSANRSTTVTGWSTPVFSIIKKSRIFMQLAIQMTATIDLSAKTMMKDRTQYERDKPEIKVIFQTN